MFFNRFPVRLETPTCSHSSNKKMAVSFAVISNAAVTRCVSVNKKGVDPFVKGTFRVEQSV